MTITKVDKLEGDAEVRYIRNVCFCAPAVAVNEKTTADFVLRGPAFGVSARQRSQYYLQDRCSVLFSRSWAAADRRFVKVSFRSPSMPDGGQEIDSMDHSAMRLFVCASPCRVLFFFFPRYMSTFFFFFLFNPCSFFPKLRRALLSRPLVLGRRAFVGLSLFFSAKISFSRGKKRYLFDFRFELKWEAPGLVCGPAKGVLIYPDVSQDCDGKYDVECQV